MPSSFVIFTTAYDEYAMQAIKSNGIDYLLKPIDEEELCEAINKVKLRPSLQARTDYITDSGGKYKERLLVYKGEDMISLSVHDIFYFCKMKVAQRLRQVPAIHTNYLLPFKKWRSN